tara:strand:- start:174 stop:407 length:234 start_codon:yes stop_codon:yes gene_type:complete
MINDLIFMNGYGIYVWSAFSFTLISFTSLYLVIKLQLDKEVKRFNKKFESLEAEKQNKAKHQETLRKILANTSTSKV